MLKNDQWVNVQSPGLAGWNNFLEAESIDDQQLAEALNIVYNGGFISPRPGSELFAAKPSGESADGLQLMEAITSDGLEYVIAVYGASFYLRQPLVDAWVKLNQTFTPTETDIYWGYINWNNGRGDDRLYACNGVDSFIRWDMAISTVVANETAGSTVVVEVADGTRFPTSGTVVIGSGGNERKETFNSRTGNNLTFNTLDADITAGESIVMEAVEKASMEKGRILGRHQSRLFVCNKFGAETSGFYSVTNDPEDFTTGSTVTAASTFTIADGNGGITDLEDFGTFLLIVKEDSHHRFSIEIADDLGSKLDRIQPIISGTSVGSISQEATIKMLNGLFYPTSTEGFISLDPRASGDSASTGLQVLSQQIQSYVTQQIDFTTCRGVAYEQLALWAITREGGSANTLVLVYDTLRGAWSLFNGWAVTDWARANKNLYYLEGGTGNIMRAFTDSYDDSNNPYNVRAVTKRFNFGRMSEPKSNDKIYIQGYMVPQTDLFVDVWFNEAGQLKQQTYRINKDTENLLYKDEVGGMLGSEELGTAMLAGVPVSKLGNLSFFRGYLGIDIGQGYYNIQLRFRSNKQAFWAVTGIGFNPEINPAIDGLMVLSPVNT